MTDSADADLVGDNVELALPSDASAAGMARAKTTSVLRYWHRLHLRDALTVVVTELVSNAVRHGGPPVSMLLTRLPRGVRVGVHDSLGDALPPEIASLPGANVEGGRGGFLVEALSSSNGVNQKPGDGKTVWAVVDRQ